MIRRKDFARIGNDTYELPPTARRDMRGPARIFADEAILEKAFEDRSIEQLVNTATLPGLVGPAMAMPDCHQGYGFPIGGVVATSFPDGVVSPGGVGYDINCGVRLLRTPLLSEQIEPHRKALAESLFRRCPSGVGVEGSLRLKVSQLDEVLVKGAGWAVSKGYGRPEDLLHTEERGAMEDADPRACSEKAKDRGKNQLGTLGSGNHFIEVDRVTEIFDEKAAEAFGLFSGQVVVQIHTGSRGFGHQVCTDYVGRLQKSIGSYGFQLPDRQLVCAPLSSREGQDYLGAMRAAANFAWANRQMLTENIRRSFDETFQNTGLRWDLEVLYDIAHNIAKLEEHTLEGGKTARVCVHRKGATRAFGPGSEALPERYREIGQPVLVPGSMGTASYVLAGTNEAMRLSFGSTCHGAGRTLSRKAAVKGRTGREVLDELVARGIEVQTGSFRGLAEERPEAYKDVDQVVRVVANAGIARIVAKLEPLAVVKG